MKHFPILKNRSGVVAQSVKHSAKNRRARVRGSPGTPTYTLMAPSACKIRGEHNILHVPFKLNFWGYQSGGPIPSVTNQNRDAMSPDHP